MRAASLVTFVFAAPGSPAEWNPLLVRSSWRQIAYHLNTAGFYAKRPPTKARPGRNAGFSLRENDDGSVLLTYSSPEPLPEEVRADMLAAYLAVLARVGLCCEAGPAGILVRGWN